jgi:hypothetical protein
MTAYGPTQTYLNSSFEVGYSRKSGLVMLGTSYFRV